MADVKTLENDGDVDAYLARVTPASRRDDALALRALLERVTGQPARLWGTSIVGFGRHHYVYASGREGDTAAVSFAPRASATTINLADGVDAHADRLAALGPHTVGAGCLYIKRLADVDTGVLEELLRTSYEHVTGGSVSEGSATPGDGT